MPEKWMLCQREKDSCNLYANCMLCPGIARKAVKTEREKVGRKRERERVDDERETVKKDKLLLKCARKSFGLCFGPETLHWPKCKSPSPIFGAAWWLSDLLSQQLFFYSSCMCVCCKFRHGVLQLFVPFSKLLGAFCVVAGLVYYLLIEMLQKVTHTRMYRQAKTERGRGE